MSALVREAAAAGIKIKAVGASHSFTAIAATDGILLRLDRMNQIISHDPATARVRVQAGISLHELNPKLNAMGLALPNLGDVDPQSVAGAVSTGTHGTGDKLFGISKTVVGVQLVTGDGEVLEIDESHAWFGASRVTLGALGILTEVTLQCVPAFLLHAREEPMALPEVLDGIDALVGDNDHFEFYWFPHTEKALIKRNNRVPEGTERQPIGRFRHWLDDEFLSNTAFGAINRVVARQRSWIPKVNNLAASMLSAREYVDDSYNVFVSPRTVRFRESEFAMPREALTDVLGELKKWFDAGHETHLVPDRGALHRRRRRVDVDGPRARQRLRRGAPVRTQRLPATTSPRRRTSSPRTRVGRTGARSTPSTRPTSPSATARFNDFVAIRDQLDPQRTFSNDYLDRVLG